jgi:hypothetical protein
MGLIDNTLKKFSGQDKEQRGHWVTLSNPSFAVDIFSRNPIEKN